MPSSRTYAAICILLLASGAVASGSRPPFDSAQVDAFVARQMILNRLPGLALAITRGDEVLYLRGYGRSRDDQPVTPQTQFLIGSVSKSFTALAIMQLVEAGTISLDAPVRQYLPEFKVVDDAAASRITIRRLLNHTSGLADAGFPEGRLPQPVTIRERVATLRLAHAVAAPGAEFHYFNPNYAVLARIVEVVTKESFEDYLQAHVFRPLRMSRTTTAVTSSDAFAKAKDLAQGRLMAFGVPFPCPEMTGYLGGSGGVISTAEDMAQYLILQNSGGRAGPVRLLSAAGIEMMHRPPQSMRTDYAMGWFVTTRNGRRIIQHDGILSVFYADVVLLENEERYGIALLYNLASMPSTILAFPGIKAGMIALLTHGQPRAAAGFTITAWGVLVAILTVMTVGLAVRSLFRVRRWVEKARRRPMWRLLPHIAWWLFPATALVAMPWLVLSTSGRSFGYEQLFRSMLDITIWLALCAVLGLFNAGIRIVMLFRERVVARDSRRQAESLENRASSSQFC